jgi:hypothetical protein
MRDYDFARSEWQIYIVLPHASINLVLVNQLEDGAFEVRADVAYARFRDPVAAFDLAVEWATIAPARRESSLCYVGAVIEFAALLFKQALPLNSKGLRLPHSLRHA